MDQESAHFRASDRPELMIVASPEDTNAWVSYRNALGFCDDHLGSRFGNQARRNQLGVLAVQWMTGIPLSHIISGRLTYESGKVKPKSDARVIRGVMSDVENEARFNVPKYLACYVDLLAVHLVEVGNEDLASRMPDLSKLLELGISSQTGFGFICRVSRPVVVVGSGGPVDGHRKIAGVRSCDQPCSASEDRE